MYEGSTYVGVGSRAEVPTRPRVLTTDDELAACAGGRGPGSFGATWGESQCRG